MNILFCGDENVSRGIMLSALTLAEHSREPLSIYILTASAYGHRAIQNEFAYSLSEKIIRKGKNSVKLLDISELFTENPPEANLSTRFTPFCMLRLFADKVKEIPDKILYLDADVLCRADFSELYGTDISEFELAGVPDRYGKWFFGNIFKHDYLNSGVLLLNMKMIRESGLFGSCREMCRERKMLMPDQTALNKLSVKLKLPQKYNEQGKIKGDTVFKHFTTYFRLFPYIHTVTVKPWETEKMHKLLKIYEFDGIAAESDIDFLSKPTAAPYER